MSDLVLSEIESIDYSEAFPEALRAEGRGGAFLALYLLDRPRMIRVDGRKRPCRYEIVYRWLSQECRDESDEAWACVLGSEVTLWHKSQIDPARSLFEQIAIL